MPILVDYACGSCGTRREIWAPSPPPTTATCVDCGAESRRAWAPIGLSSAAATPASSSAPSSAPRRSLCASYPQVPGLCHLSESAGRMAVAKYLGDNRRIDREQERQEKAAAVKAPVLSDAISHHHT